MRLVVQPHVLLLYKSDCPGWAMYRAGLHDCGSCILAPLGVLGDVDRQQVRVAPMPCGWCACRSAVRPGVGAMRMRHAAPCTLPWLAPAGEPPGGMGWMRRLPAQHECVGESGTPLQLEVPRLNAVAATLQW
jgi:hypothetical protein